MIKLNHSIKFVTEIDENKMPDHLLSAFVNLNELQMEMLLRQTLTAAFIDLDVLDRMNAGNSWAVLKLAE
jgi:hypothetical protein